MLRIEDIDTARCRPAFEAGIQEDLTWLGLNWEMPVRRQSERMADYAEALERLRVLGLLYRCFRTRRDALDDIARAPHGDAEVFSPGPLSIDEEQARLADGQPFAWRLSLTAAEDHLGGFAALNFQEDTDGSAGPHGLIKVQPNLAGDVVLGRKDLGVSYHLAVVVDDADQRISHVIRGQDLFAATHIQRLLQALLDLPTPVYRHHRLLLRDDGKRFAKRDTTETLADLRARGVTPRTLRTQLGF